MTYALHPLCKLFPRMSDAEFSALVDDISAHGLRQPITLFEGMILDGGNRYDACLAAGVEPVFVSFEYDDPVAFVLSNNLHRRHLSAGQQAAIVALAEKWELAHPPHRVEARNLAPLSTVADRMAKSGASERTQQMADKVAKTSPELAKKVGHGDVSLPAAIEQITGKRPGTRQKPVDVAPVVASAPAVDPVEPPESTTEPAADPNHVDLLPDLLQAEGEIKRLSAIVASLEAVDTTRTIIDLHERVAGLEGRLRQESNSKNEYFKQAQYWQKRHDRAEKRALAAEAKLAALESSGVAA